MKTYLIRDECGYQTGPHRLAEAVKTIKEADWNGTPYAEGWEAATETVPEPKTDSADALNAYVVALHEAAELHALDAPEDWCQGNVEQYLANTSVPFRVEDDTEEDSAKQGDILDLDAWNSIPTHEVVTRTCPACGSTVELEYIPPHDDRHGYWTGRCVCGSGDVLQVTE